MGTLVSKTSSQAFFLRILKVIVQIRDAVRVANTKKNTETEAVAQAATTAAVENAMETAPANNSGVEALTNDSTAEADPIAMDTTQATTPG